MVTRAGTKDPSADDRVWIELEGPGKIERRDEVADRRAKAATKLLRMLGDDITQFWWNKHKARYCLKLDTGGSYVELANGGHWFNLTYMTAGPVPLKELLPNE